MQNNRLTLANDMRRIARERQSNYSEPNFSTSSAEENIKNTNADYASRILLRNKILKWILIFGAAGFLIMSAIIFYLIYWCVIDGITENELSMILDFLKWYSTGTLIEIIASITYTVKQLFSIPK